MSDSCFIISVSSGRGGLSSRSASSLVKNASPSMAATWSTGGVRVSTAGFTGISPGV